MHVETRKFDAHRAEELNRPERHRAIDPTALLQWAGLRPGDRVFDLGCGTGFFTRPASQIVESEGLVIGLDVNRDMLHRFREVGSDGRILLLLCPEGDVPLRTNAFDFAILGFVLHEVEDPKRILREVRRTLREKGRILIVEWEKKPEDHGPPVSHRLSDAETKKLLLDEGFVPVQSKAIGESYYAVLAERLSFRCCGARAVHYE